MRMRALHKEVLPREWCGRVCNGRARKDLVLAGAGEVGWSSGLCPEVCIYISGRCSSCP
jgi:hypothetical protein